MTPSPVITIDGASGTGKGVVTQRIATHLGWHILDSGVLYRVLAYAASKENISFGDEKALAALADRLAVQFRTEENGPPLIFLDNENVSARIRTEEVGNNASKIAALPLVRAALLARQRAFRQSPGLVTDGRDMGTVVFPDASFKIFLTASAEERAKRRYHQLKDLGIHANLSDLLLSLKERDKRDQERPISPLKPAEDALCIATDHLNVSQVVECIMAELKKRYAHWVR